MIGEEINCLKNVGLLELGKATSYCQFLNASQILPRSRQESDDLVSALLSLDLVQENGTTLVSVGIHKTTEGLWYDSSGQLVSYFNWLPDEPDNLDGSQNYAGFRIDKLNGDARWADYSGSVEFNVVCTTRVYQGNNKIYIFRKCCKTILSGVQKYNIKSKTQSVFI